MLIAFLLLALSVSPVADIDVDVVEINKSGPVKQIILRRWQDSYAGRSHHVAQWWIIHTDPLVLRCGNKWLVYTSGLAITAGSVMRSKNTTEEDPEIAEREAFSETARTPYMPGWPIP